jgi:hypothetical protein
MSKFALISGLRKFKKFCKIMDVSEEWHKSRTVRRLYQRKGLICLLVEPRDEFKFQCHVNIVTK